MNDQDKIHLREAIAIAMTGMNRGDGGPFGCVIVKDGQVIGRGNNRVTSTNDPTAHAEIVAIREACAALGDFQLTGCTVYASCEPCPMCLGAIYWARPERLVFASTRKDAAQVGFDDQLIYDELPMPTGQRRIPTINILREEGSKALLEWSRKKDRTPY